MRCASLQASALALNLVCHGIHSMRSNKKRATNSVGILQAPIERRNFCKALSASEIAYNCMRDETFCCCFDNTHVSDICAALSEIARLSVRGLHKAASRLVLSPETRRTIRSSPLSSTKSMALRRGLNGRDFSMAGNLRLYDWDA